MRMFQIGYVALSLCFTASVFSADLEVGRYKLDCAVVDHPTVLTVFPSAGPPRLSLELEGFSSSIVASALGSCAGNTCFSALPKIDVRYTSPGQIFWHPIGKCLGGFVDLELSEIQQFGSEIIYLKVNRPQTVTYPGCEIEWAVVERVLTRCH